MTYAPPRPWYCPDALVDDYRAVADSGGDLRMLKTLKIIRSIIVNVGIVAVTVAALIYGADPTWVGGTGLLTLAAYNGVEYADYQALVQGYAEARDQASDGEGNQ